MAFDILPGEAVITRVYCKNYDQIAVNVLHYVREPGVGPAVTSVDYAGVVNSVLSSLYAAVMPTSAEYRGVGVQLLPVGGITPVEYYPAPNPGIVAGESLPKQVSGVIALRSTVGGRSGRGRVYVGFPSEADNESAGKPSVSYVQRLQALADALNSPLTVPDINGTGQVFSLHVYSRLLAFLADVTQVVARDRWGTQRRRGDFGKINTSPV